MKEVTSSVEKVTYKRLGQLGTGGLGQVNLIQYPTGFIAAEKRFQLPKNLSPEYATHIRTVAPEIHLQLAHPHIVNLFEIIPGKNGAEALIMEFMNNHTLKQRIQKGKTRSLHPEQAFHTFQEILSGLAELHKQGLVHGDLKNSNIMYHTEVRGKEVAKLVDLDTAQYAKQEPSKIGFGTITHMAPDLFMGLRGPMPDQDIYGITVSLFEALTGKLPYGGRNRVDHFDYVFRNGIPPTSIGEIFPDKSDRIKELDSMIKRGLDHDPTKRFDAPEYIEHLAYIQELWTKNQNADPITILAGWSAPTTQNAFLETKKTELKRPSDNRPSRRPESRAKHKRRKPFTRSLAAITASVAALATFANPHLAKEIGIYETPPSINNTQISDNAKKEAFRKIPVEHHNKDSQPRIKLVSFNPPNEPTTKPKLPKKNNKPHENKLPKGEPIHKDPKSPIEIPTPQPKPPEPPFPSDTPITSIDPDGIPNVQVTPQPTQPDIITIPDYPSSIFPKIIIDKNELKKLLEKQKQAKEKDDDNSDDD